MQAKFTPGPWAFESQRGTNKEHCFWGVTPKTKEFEYRGEVCSVSDAAHIGGITEDEALANARLIAAAPELYEALQSAVKMLGPRLLKDTFGLEWWEKTSVAIAKATGEPL